ncbi:pentapeptide repeat-containing protein [Chondromyces crocatus]|uniref:NACHT domain-containing protein n=1 Tax=Chondromyces crocatus TaxID=52 RepID=A0A0K1EID6_CHOCO|nr:pentapeptide repeat-containing protein [Chondromyces crocatus]AKT40457.1 uncharacterized protein CMC5_046120 [Chondromyces crocatus]
MESEFDMDAVTIDGAWKVAGEIFRAALTEDRFQPRWTLDAEALLALTRFAKETRALAALLPPGALTASEDAVAHHIAILLRAFALALTRQSALHSVERRTHQAPGERASLDMESEALRPKGAEPRLRLALDHLARADVDVLGPPFERLSDLVDAPLASPVYKALCAVFAQAALSADAIPPALDLATPAARTPFERLYLLAHAEAMTSPLGAAFVRALHATASMSPSFLRGVLMRSLSASRVRSMFGEADALRIPHLPLEAFDLDLLATWTEPPNFQRHATPRPLLGLIDELLAKHRIVIVCGAPGRGQSLTARKITSAWADRHVTVDPSMASDLTFPLVIDGGRDIAHHDPSLGAAVRCALQRKADSLGITAVIDEASLAVTSPGDRVVYVVDGLDEAGLTLTATEALFRDLVHATRDTHRAIVFSRKAALPDTKAFAEHPIVYIEDLSPHTSPAGGQIAAWLERWNLRSGKAPLTVEQFKERGLVDAAGTPLVLFMRALTWEAQPPTDGSDDEGVARPGLGQPQGPQGALHERFFRQLATAQCDHARACDAATWEAFTRLLHAVSERHPGEVAFLEDDPSAARAQGMLWLLSRLAWAIHGRRGRGQALTVQDAVRLLEAELGVTAEPWGRQLVRAAMTLMLPLEPAGEDGPLVFGHRAFREFFVARYWALVLRRIVARPGAEARRVHEGTLLEGRLLGAADESFAFLLEKLNGPSWSEAEREALLQWAHDAFVDETSDFLRPERPRWEEDRRPALREAALAIGSLMSGATGMVVGERRALKTLLASLSITVPERSVKAPRFSCEDADLEGVNLAGFDLEGANLPRANLVDANLVGTNLVGANLSGANLTRANLLSVKLGRANLAGAHLEDVSAFLADFRGANLLGASLEEKALMGAKLEGALRDPPKPTGKKR